MVAIVDFVEGYVVYIIKVIRNDLTFVLLEMMYSPCFLFGKTCAFQMTDFVTKLALGAAMRATIR